MSADRARIFSAKFWLLTVAAMATLSLALVNTVLARKNQAVQAEINTRQQYINQTIRISRLNSEVIQALANLSARSGDEQIRRLLADHRISFSAGTDRVESKSTGESPQEAVDQ